MEPPVELSYAECRELLGAGVFGRIAVCTPDGPKILPVNYSLVSETVVFRTSAHGLVAAHDWGSPIAFEIDDVNYAEHRGWSVLATGPGERIEDPDQLSLVRRTWEPQPWAGGDRSLYVRLAWDELTGRRLGGGWNRNNEMPVRRTLR